MTRTAKVIKKGNNVFGILREGGDNKTYTMKTLGNFVVNEIPYMSFDLSGLPELDRKQITRYGYRGMRHHAKRKLQR